MSKSTKRLTNRDYETLSFIKSYIDRHGYAPSYKEIGDGVGLHSNCTVHSHMQKLIEFGEIETDHPGSPRAIRLKKDIELP